MNFPKRSGVEGVDKQGGVNYRGEKHLKNNILPAILGTT